WRQRARGAESRARRESPSHHERTLSRELRRHPGDGASGAASPRADELPRGIRRDHDRSDGGRIVECRGGPRLRNVAERSSTGLQACLTMQHHSSDATAMPGARFVDPKILARIGNLELLARTVVDGFINGLHRAPYFGASI